MYKMGVATYKHEIKTLFLVVNSCIALTIGLFPVSVGTTMVLIKVPEPEVVLGSLLIGTFVLGMALLGHFGAIREKKAMLSTYAVAVGLVTAMELLAVTKLMPKITLDALVFLIFHIVLTLSSLLLAIALKKAHTINHVLPETLVAAPTTPTQPTLPSLPTAF